MYSRSDVIPVWFTTILEIHRILFFLAHKNDYFVRHRVGGREPHGDVVAGRLRVVRGGRIACTSQGVSGVREV